MQALQALKASADTLFHIQQKAQVILWRRNLQSTCKIRRFWRHDPTLQDWNQSPPDRGEAGCRQPESHGQRKEPTEQPVCGLEELPEQVPNSFPPPLLWKKHFSKSKDFIQSLFQGTTLRGSDRSNCSYGPGSQVIPQRPKPHPQHAGLRFPQLHLAVGLPAQMLLAVREWVPVTRTCTGREANYCRQSVMSVKSSHYPAVQKQLKVFSEGVKGSFLIRYSLLK